jgi:hypothetical protein
MSVVPKQVAGAGAHKCFQDFGATSDIRCRLKLIRRIVHGCTLTKDETADYMLRLIGCGLRSNDLVTILDAPVPISAVNPEFGHDFLAEPFPKSGGFLVIFVWMCDAVQPDNTLPYHLITLVTPFDETGYIGDALKQAHTYGKHAIMGIIDSVDQWPFLPCEETCGYTWWWLVDREMLPDQLSTVDDDLTGMLGLKSRKLLMGLRYRQLLCGKQPTEDAYEPGMTGAELYFKHKDKYTQVVQIRKDDLGQKIFDSDDKLRDGWAYVTLTGDYITRQAIQEAVETRKRKQT